MASSDFQISAPLHFNRTSSQRGDSYRGIGDAFSKPQPITFNLLSSFPKEAPGNRIQDQDPLGIHFTMELEP